MGTANRYAIDSELQEHGKLGRTTEANAAFAKAARNDAPIVTLRRRDNPRGEKALIL